MFGLGFWELLIILVIILVIFGAGKLPQVGEALGKGLSKFRGAMEEKSDKAESPDKPAAAAGATATATPPEKEEGKQEADTKSA